MATDSPPRTYDVFEITPSLAIAFVAGVLAVQELPSLPASSFDALLAITALAAIRYRRLRAIAVAALGFAWCAWRAQVALDARLPERFEGRDFDVIGIVDALPVTTSEGVRTTFRIDHASIDGVDLPLRGEIRLAWYDAEAGVLDACSRWQLRVRLKRPRGLVNPGGLDTEQLALERGIFAIGSVRRADTNRRVGDVPRCIDGLRARIAEEIERRVADPHDAALVRAFAIGDTRGLDEGDWDIARINGISHLIAISGFHVGVAAGLGALLVRVWGWLFPRLGLRVPIAVIAIPAALATGVFYGALAGGSLPTVRTLLMIAVVAAARAGRRLGNGVQALSLAVVAILIVDPLAVLSPGCWLSFAGAAFLMSCLTHHRGVLGFLRELTFGQLVMSLALLPLTVWFFGQASLVGAVSNLVAVPFVSFVIVPLCLAALLALLIAPPLATPLLGAAAAGVHVQWAMFDRIAAWPGAQIYLPASSIGALALAMLGAAWMFAPRGVPARAIGFVLFLPLLLPSHDPIAPGAFEAVFIDVGQGLSILLRTREHALLYDAGARYPEFDLGKAAVLPTLHALGVSQLDKLIVSHGDNDHAGGAPAVAREFANADRLGGEPYRGELAMRQCIAGETWTWDGVRFRMISPTPDRIGAPAARGNNDRSCVLLVEGEGSRLLLPGDISSRIEPRIAEAIPNDARPLVLAVAHHGSHTSSSAAFVADTRPALAVASAGWHNPYGHPHPEVVARFRDAGVPLLNTAGLGALTIAFPATGKPAATAERARRRRYWRERIDPPCCPLGSPSQSGAAPRCYDSRPSGPCDDA